MGQASCDLKKFQKNHIDKKKNIHQTRRQAESL